MQTLAGKVAFITGGASGVGFGIARALAEANMKLVLADIQPASLEKAKAMLQSYGVPVLTLTLDVTDRAAFSRAADQVDAAFGGVHVLCNNAGIGLVGDLKAASYEDWDWVLGVNLGGVINGIQTFLPRMMARGEGGHILATASAAGLIAGAGIGIYTTSKMAVVGLMECLRGDVAANGIGVSVLCPHLVRTNIHEYERLRPRQGDDAATGRAGDAVSNPQIKALVDLGMDPLEVGRRVRRGIERNDLYILTHPEIGPIIRERFEALLAALPDEPADPARVAAEASTLHYSVYTERG